MGKIATYKYPDGKLYDWKVVMGDCVGIQAFDYNRYVELTVIKEEHQPFFGCNCCVVVPGNYHIKKTFITKRISRDHPVFNDMLECWENLRRLNRKEILFRDFGYRKKAMSMDVIITDLDRQKWLRSLREIKVE